MGTPQGRITVALLRVLRLLGVLWAALTGLTAVGVILVSDFLVVTESKAEIALVVAIGIALPGIGLLLAVWANRMLKRRER